MTPTIVVSGDRDVALRIEKFPDALHKRMRGAIERLTARLFAAVQPPRKTGRLASEKRMTIDETPDAVRGRVTFAATGTEAAKIAALEYGAHNPIKGGVSEHKRSLDHLWSLAISPMEVIVDRYNRTPNIAEHRFLRGPLAAMQDDAKRELTEAADGAARDTGTA